LLGLWTTDLKEKKSDRSKIADYHSFSSRALSAPFLLSQ
jgi:hypothetical protein